jgi:hypothetical protein
MLRFAMFEWWNRVGDTKASGITKLVMSEASNFPTIAAFYQDNVVKPGHLLIRSILQRGIERGEFRTLDMNYAVYSVIAPLIFLTMWKHSIGTCCADMPLDPVSFINSQADIVIQGILTQAASAPSSAPSTSTATPSSPI